MDAVDVALLVASGALSVLCWVALWRGPDGLTLANTERKGALTPQEILAGARALRATRA